MKKMLITYASFGNGHKTCALSLYNYYKEKNYQINLIDINDYLTIWGRLIKRLYYFIIRFKGLYNFIYLKTNNNQYYKKYNLFLKSLYQKKLFIYIKQMSPDIVLSTHYFPGTLISNYNIKTKIVTILTDYSIHYTWYYNLKNENALIVPTNQIRNYLSVYDLDIQKVYVAGIPSLTYQSNIKQIANRKKTILFIYSSHNYYYLTKLLSLELDINIIFIIPNKYLRAIVINKIKKRNYQNVKVYGYIHKLVNIIKIVDMVITKPGGLIITETLKESKPLLLIKGYEGQEKYNYRFVINNNFGYYNENFKTLIKNVIYLLDDKNYNQVVENIRNYQFKSSLDDINKIINNII